MTLVNPYESPRSADKAAATEGVATDVVRERTRHAIAVMSWGFAAFWSNAVVAFGAEAARREAGTGRHVGAGLAFAVLDTFSSSAILVATFMLAPLARRGGRGWILAVRGLSAVWVACNMACAFFGLVWGELEPFATASYVAGPLALASCCWYGGVALRSLEVRGALWTKVIAILTAAIYGLGGPAIWAFERTVGRDDLYRVVFVFTARGLLSIPLGVGALVLGERLRCALKLRPPPPETSPANPREPPRTTEEGASLSSERAADGLRRALAIISWAFVAFWSTLAVSTVALMACRSLRLGEDVASLVKVTIPTLDVFSSAALLAATFMVPPPVQGTGRRSMLVARGLATIWLASNAARVTLQAVSDHASAFDAISECAVPLAFAGCCWYVGEALGALDFPGGALAKIVAVAIAVFEGGGALVVAVHLREGGPKTFLLVLVITLRNLLSLPLATAALMLAERLRCVLQSCRAATPSQATSAPLRRHRSFA